MAKDSLKLLLLAGIVGFAVLYGMELSSSGMKRVYGPMDPPEATVQSTDQPDAEGDVWTLPPRNSGRGHSSQNHTVQDGVREDADLAIPRNDSKPLVDRVSAATAEALHSLSSGGIKFVVSLFDKVTGS
ncbi:hypothetical protein GE107_02480 [Cohnella sp. CFH 77786]|uniref:YqxA family protein n=1 Tax=Cohnella sp. CFH 77786 TaxID=2662265 RepID=UPI001C60A9B7|nr:YqxA family protein [Cohnella sp. CFH 77786]MBW5444931.1 hypothetical protein [Cohnella sp. CFH 77786]